MNFFEYLKDLTDTAKERIKTPITGAFTLAFLFYNWKPISILLFSSTDISTKIEDINDKYSTWDSVVIPLIFALIYIILIPWSMVYIERWTQPAITDRKKHLRKLKLEDTKDLKEQIIQETENELLRNGQKQLQDMNDANQDLINQIDKLKEEHKARLEELEATYNTQINNSREATFVLVEDINQKRAQIDKNRNHIKVLEGTIQEMFNALNLEFTVGWWTEKEADEFVNFYVEMKENPKKAIYNLDNKVLSAYLNDRLLTYHNKEEGGQQITEYELTQNAKIVWIYYTRQLL